MMLRIGNAAVRSIGAVKASNKTRQCRVFNCASDIRLQFQIGRGAGWSRPKSYGLCA